MTKNLVFTETLAFIIIQVLLLPSCTSHVGGYGEGEGEGEEEEEEGDMDGLMEVAAGEGSGMEVAAGEGIGMEEFVELAAKTRARKGRCVDIERGSGRERETEREGGRENES